MHFHLPKPLHGWREFVGEVGIILLGVLLALGAESLIEDLRWHHQVSIAQDGINDELGVVALKSYERVLLQPCISARLSELGALLRASKGQWKGSPMVVNGSSRRALLAAYRTPNRPLVVDAWQNSETSGTLNHMPSKQVLEMARIYSQDREFYELQQEEARSAARLMPLAYDADLTPDMRVNMLAAIGDIDRINALMALMATQMIDHVRSLHLGFDRAQIELEKRKLVDQSLNAYGRCVIDIPLRV